MHVSVHIFITEPGHLEKRTVRSVQSGESRVTDRLEYEHGPMLFLLLNFLMYVDQWVGRGGSTISVCVCTFLKPFRLCCSNTIVKCIQF